MRANLRLLIFILLLPMLLLSDGHDSRARTASAPSERIRFMITTIEESAGGVRNVLSETTVEGPPGTDFNINLQHAGFKMRAHFLTDLVSRNRLRMRAKLDTRRFYGYSQQQLPLYEEDAQTAALEVGFEEALVLLPFGAGGGDTLRIEITPARSDRASTLAGGKKRPLEIEINRPAQGGFISVEAFKVPHRFTVEAALFEDGREVARGTSENLLEEARELLLQPGAQASAELHKSPLLLSLSVEQFMRGRPLDEAAVSFDIYRTDAGAAAERQAIARKWAGIAELDSDLVYDLSRSYAPAPGRRYELKLRVRLAPGESSD